MKNFKMNFYHPVKGILRLFKEDTAFAAHVIAINTAEDESFDISLSAIEKGKWKLVLDWEYDEKQFSYNRDIIIT